MSVEIRWPVGEEGRCFTVLGEVEHPEPRPDRGEVGHLMLAAADWVAQLITDGPQLMRWGGVFSASTDARGTFVRLDYEPFKLGLHAWCGVPVPEPESLAGSWTWQMHDAHWSNDRGVGCRPLMIGCWPD